MILVEACPSRILGRSFMAVVAVLFATPSLAMDLTQKLPPNATTNTGTPINVDVQEVKREDGSDPYDRNRLFSGNKYKVETKVNDSFSVNSSLRFERARTSVADEPADNASVYLDQMFVRYEWENTAGFRLGKFENPRFGVANPGAREVGVFGRDSPLNGYETGRALGVNPYTNFGGNGLTGRYRLDASIFRFDESPFAGNWADYREPDPGAITDTPAPPPSVAFALNGSDPFQLRGLGYHLGYQLLSRGAAETDREAGMAAGLSYGTILSGTKVRTAAEIGYMRHVDGLHDGDLLPGMAVQSTIDDQWRAFANYSARSADGSETSQDRSYGAGIGYSFQAGPNLDLAWNRKVEHQTSLDQPTAQDSVGIKLKYGVKF